MTDRTLELARRLHALARTGLHFCSNEYDRERYSQIEQVAAELLSGDSTADRDALLALWRGERGYVTPKIEVRGAVFRDGQVLLVRETVDGRWTLPGGWADVNEAPSHAFKACRRYQEVVTCLQYDCLFHDLFLSLVGFLTV